MEQRTHRDDPLIETSINLLIEGQERMERKLDAHIKDDGRRINVLEFAEERRKATDDTRNAFVKAAIGIGTIVVALISAFVSWLVGG